MNAERCVLCGKVIPEGSQVCHICRNRVYESSCPTGYLTIMDVRKLSRLRGDQIHKLFDDYGVMVNDRMLIKFETFDKLKQAGKLGKYETYPLAQKSNIRK